MNRTAIEGSRSRAARERVIGGALGAALLLLAVQTEGIMEGRFRKPVDPIVLAALSLQLRPRR